MSTKEQILKTFEGRWADFYGEYVDLSARHNGQVKVCSPFREETEPSFQIDFEGTFAGRYHDFGSGEHGDIFAFYARKHNLDVKRDFPRVLEGICADFGIQPPVNGKAEKKTRTVQQTRTLTERGNSLETAKAFRVQEFTGQERKDRWVDPNIVFPVPREDGQVLGFKVHKGVHLKADGNVAGRGEGIPPQLYPWKALAFEGVTYFANGEPSVWRAWEAGYRNVICSTGGEKSFQAERSNRFTGKHVRVAFDNDKTGQEATEKVASLLYGKAAFVEVVIWPKDWKEKGDVEDWLNAGHRLEDLEFQAWEPPAEEPHRIYAGDDGFTPVLEATRKALQAANDPPVLFRRGGHIVTVEATEDGDLVISPASPDGLREHMARAAEWYRTGREGERPSRPPLDVARTILDGPKDFLPILSRIIRSPILAPSGRIVSRPGYDTETRTFYAGEIDIPGVSEHPTEEQVWEAAGLLQTDLLGDFPFVDEADAANAVGMFLLPFARELIGGPTPLHLIEKPAPGSGASLLVEALGVMARGTAPVMMTEGRDDDEWRKRITSTLSYSPEVVAIDNLRRKLDSAALSSALTSRIWTDRRLGATENVTLPVRCAWVATGNNPAVSSEIARRSVPIRIDPKVDRPWERPTEQFKHPDLLAWATENRGELAWAALTLLRAWIAAGRPSGKESLGSYEEWARVIGGVLDVAAIPGFLENRSRFYDRADRETNNWRAFVDAWWESYQETAVGVRDLWKLIEPEDGAEPVEPPANLGNGTERSQKTRLGQTIAQAVDRRFLIDGSTFTLESAGTSKRAAQFRLKSG